jgi:uncharacterized protein
MSPYSQFRPRPSTKSITSLAAASTFVPRPNTAATPAFVSNHAICYTQPMNSAHILAKLKTDRHALNSLGVASLKLFGSAARDAAGADSDADFLVRFKDAPTYDRFMDLKFHLEDALGIQVDLVTEDALRPEMRQSVERDALLVA